MKIFRTTDPSPGKPRWRLGVLIANLVTIGVGASAGFVSWQHLSKLGKDVGATEESAFLTPFTIDGMILAGTLELRQARIEHRPAKVWAYVAVLIGVIGTIAGNVRAAQAGNLTAQLYFAAPALAFLISVEVLFGKPLSRNLWDLIRGWWASARKTKTPEPETIKAPPAETPAKAPESPVEPLTPRLVPALPTPARTPARRAPARAARKTGEPVVGTRTNPARLVDGVVLEGEALREDARRRIAEALAGGRERDGLGAWVARQYEPEMSSRWGLERVGEVPGQQVPDAPDRVEIMTAPVSLIGPMPVVEKAEALPESEPARV